MAGPPQESDNQILGIQNNSADLFDEVIWLASPAVNMQVAGGHDGRIPGGHSPPILIRTSKALGKARHPMFRHQAAKAHVIAERSQHLQWWCPLAFIMCTPRGKCVVSDTPTHPLVS